MLVPVSPIARGGGRGRRRPRKKPLTAFGSSVGNRSSNESCNRLQSLVTPSPMEQFRMVDLGESSSQKGKSIAEPRFRRNYDWEPQLISALIHPVEPPLHKLLRNQWKTWTCQESNSRSWRMKHRQQNHGPHSSRAIDVQRMVRVSLIFLIEV
ncbi:hypothetical protein RND71_003980 [Anisodus tanguticus]|uniref:Uncharacterized protein n=1 Tax=Anisodus tanguticus TaxID=243964 RepID=A0AAE1SVL6_9SOLA|nr:hypothetical protein RND71_003980 [Anisodus tanguticus]